MPSPSRHSCHCKNWGKKIGRQAKAVVHRRGIKIHIGLQFFLRPHDVGDPLAHLNPLRFSQLSRQLFRHPLQVRGPRIQHLINAMSNSHNLLLLTHLLLHPGIHFLQRSNLLKHVDHTLIRPSVQRTLQCPDGCANRGINIGQCRGTHPCRKGGGIHPVIRMQNKRHVQRGHRLRPRLLTIEKIKKVSGFPQISSNRRKGLPPTRTVKIGRDHPDFGCKGNLTLSIQFHMLRSDRIIIVEPKHRHTGPQNIHRTRIFGCPENVVHHLRR